MNTKNNILLFAASVMLLTTSCDRYLDVQPDNRVMIDTPDKVQQLLINAYPNANYMLVTELSADNYIDNNAPNSAGITHSLTSYNRMDDEIFAWRDPLDTDTDSPYDIWEKFYQSIASANAALQAIDELIQKGVSDDDLNNILLPAKGEALILRAYSHFILVNIFAQTYKDAETSKADMGVPYATKSATVIGTQYERNSVAEVYELIDKDIQAGIGLIRDGYYKVPKYHFNSKAAHAFAAQFYLFKRDYPKVIENANYVLGADPTASLRDWVTVYPNSDQILYAYINVESPANLLLIPTYSVFFRRNFPNNARYCFNGDAFLGNIYDSGPTWSGTAPFYVGKLYLYDQTYGLFSPKIKELFEYTDRVAGIGYAHIVRTEYTTDATLLDRAEAYIYTGQIDKAVNDLETWNKSHRSSSKVPTTLTAAVIKSFYTPGKKYFSYTFNTEKLSPQFIVTPEQKPFVDCVIHFRRLERIFEGHRWFDIKRYGIELQHKIGRSGTIETLPYNDDRRAIQIPSDVIGAGITENPRTVPSPPANLTPQPLVDNN